MKWIALVVVVAAACGDNLGKLDYTWDDRRVLCSEPVDDLVDDVNWDTIDGDLAAAEQYHWAALFHAHTPGVTVTTGAIDRLFTAAEAHHLAPLTYRDLAPSSDPQGAIALAFDDNAPDQWFTLRDLLDAHAARVTFFVARYTEMTPLGHDELAMLAGDGHDLEPHTVNHLHGVDYVAANGMDAYLADEVLPSFQVLTDAGYPPATTFAYPFGEHTDAMDDAVLAHVAKVRTTPGPCPW